VTLGEGHRLTDVLRLVEDQEDRRREGSEADGIQEQDGSQRCNASVEQSLQLPA